MRRWIRSLIREKPSAQNDHVGTDRDREESQQVPSAQHRHEVAQNANAHLADKQESEPTPEIRAHRLAVATLALEAVIAVSAWIGAYYVYEQLHEMRVANELTREAIVASNRALVLPRIPAGLPLLETGEARAQYIEIVNFGGAAATKLSSRISEALIRAEHLVDCVPATDPVPYSSHVVLGPGASSFVNAEVPPLDRATIVGLREQRLFMYLVGHVRYMDGFGNERRSTFCFVHTGEDRWKFCRNNNWIDDEECK